jgi:hypothetical protein
MALIRVLFPKPPLRNVLSGGDRQASFNIERDMPEAPIRWALVRDPSGDRDPVAILGPFVCRWRLETTFQEARQHLGVGTKRQWSDLAMLRTTPALLGLYSLVTVWAYGLMQASQSAVKPHHPAAWYNKNEPTFSDAIGAVRCVLWSPTGFSMSRSGAENVEIPLLLFKRFVETPCLAA